MNQIRYAIVFVSDMPRSVAFYRDVLGLPLKYETPKWTEFGTTGTTLALHAAGAPAVQCQTGRGAPPGHAQLGFNVPDLDAFHTEMMRKNVRCLMPPTRQEFGARLAGYADPDGLPFTVGEPFTEKSHQ
jgi:lactoylglutathione lyase